MEKQLRFDLTVDSSALLCPNPIDFYTKAYISEDIVNNFRTLPDFATGPLLSFVDMILYSKPLFVFL